MIDLDNPTAMAVGGTGNLPATNELPVDMHPKMMDSYVGLTPITSMLTRISEKEGTNFRHDWIEKKEIPTTVVVATGESSASTTVYVVANGTTLVQDTLLYNARCDDLRLVDSTPTTNTVTVSLNQGGKTSAVWKAGDVVHVLLPAVAENDNTHRNVSVADENVYNYQQLCLLEFAITRLQDAMKTHFGGRGSKRQELKMQKYREYRIKKEKMLYFGGRATGGTAPASKRMAGGIVHFLRNGTLYKDFGGIMTESGFRNYLGNYKDQNPDAMKVYHFCAGGVADIISYFGADKVRISPESKTFGLDISTYKSRGLTCQIVTLPLLDADPVTSGWGFTLDLERVAMKSIDRDMYVPWDRTAAGGEVIYDKYRGVYSLMLANESRHAMMVGAKL
jgi:hypothetical protein